MPTPLKLSNNVSMPVAVEQQAVPSTLSQFAITDMSEMISVFKGPGTRMGVSLSGTKSGVKVAGLSAEGLGKYHLSVGDTILEINGKRVESEDVGHKLMRDTAGEVTLKVVKRVRTDSDTESDATNRTAQSSENTERNAPPSAPPSPPSSQRAKKGSRFGWTSDRGSKGEGIAV